MTPVRLNLRAPQYYVESEDRKVIEVPLFQSKPIAYWLYTCAGLVLVIIIVGGLTRLTESGLSIVEWRPVTGAVLPMTPEAWEIEFAKYRATPEYARLRGRDYTLKEFKRIYLYEWAHRNLARFVGLVYVGPLIVLTLRRKLPLPVAGRLFAIAGLFATQAAIGWIMVMSGLDPDLFDPNYPPPRVSHVRLCLHLTTAFVIGASMFAMANAIRSPHAASRVCSPSSAHAAAVRRALRSSTAAAKVLRARNLARASAVTVTLAVLLGGLVAGLDAGLVHGTFPLMGGRIIPDDLLPPAVASALGVRGAVAVDTGAPPRQLTFGQRVRACFEHETFVQFIHRTAGLTAFGLSLATAVAAHRAIGPVVQSCAAGGVTSSRVALFGRARTVRTLVPLVTAGACGQAALGVAALLMQCPLLICVSHQTNAALLLVMLMRMSHALTATAVAVGPVVPYIPPTAAATAAGGADAHAAPAAPRSAASGARDGPARSASAGPVV